MATSTAKSSSAKRKSPRSSSKADTGVDVVIKHGDRYTLVQYKAPKVVKHGDTYLVGGTDAKKLVGVSSREVQSSPHRGKLSAGEISSLVKRMKVAA